MGIICYSRYCIENNDLELINQLAKVEASLELLLQKKIRYRNADITDEVEEQLNQGGDVNALDFGTH